MSGVMAIIQNLNEKNDLAYALMRIFLGLALFIRGVVFFSNPGALIELAGDESLYMWFSYVTISHLAGGLLLAAGFFTRLGALLQIPVLFGAVFVVSAQEGLATANQSLELAALVLFMLVVYFIFGSGSLSLDEYLAKKSSGKSKLAGV